MATWVPARKWKSKGPVTVIQKIRARKSKKVRVVRKPATVTQKQ